MSVKEFLAEVGARSAAPGGGSVAALAGALGAALVRMVAGLSIPAAGAKGTEEERKMRFLLDEAAKLAENLEAAVDEDARAFNRVMEAYRLPRETAREKEERAAAVQQALQAAALHPLGVARECLKVLRYSLEAAGGNPNALSDAGVAFLIAHCGLTGALLNVAINLGGIKDGAFKDRLAAEMENMLDEAAGLFTRARRIFNSGLPYAVFR
jgi:formiminotetrahydrofolate cyclodeaminase